MPPEQISRREEPLETKTILIAKRGENPQPKVDRVHGAVLQNVAGYLGRASAEGHMNVGAIPARYEELYVGLK